MLSIAIIDGEYQIKYPKSAKFCVCMCVCSYRKMKICFFQTYNIGMKESGSKMPQTFFVS